MDLSFKYEIGCVLGKSSVLEKSPLLVLKDQNIMVKYSQEIIDKEYSLIYEKELSYEQL